MPVIFIYWHCPCSVCHAICLEQLTAQELIAKVTEKLGIPLQSVSSLVRLTSTGILVLVDNTVSTTPTLGSPTMVNELSRQEVNLH